MNRVPLSEIPRYLQSQRWFGGKAWPIKQVSIADHVSIDLPGGKDALIAIVDVTYELGTPERYVLPIVPRPDQLTDAFEDDNFARVLIQLLSQRGRLPSSAGALQGERLEGAPALLDALSPTPKLRRLSVEQSNTSIAVDDKVILKLLRKLEAGFNPEYEMGRVLLERKFAGAPALLGALKLEGPSDTLLAVAHEYVSAKSDGWAFLLDQLRRSPVPSSALLNDISALGARVAELHQVLAQPTDDPAFSPEPILKEDLQRWSSSIIGELGVTLNLAAETMPHLSKKREALIGQAQKLAQLEPAGEKIRVHGDLHLGQTLKSSDRGWMIFDFEGEPVRTFVQRREKSSPLRDVAGMLRSLAYAVATVEKEDQPPEARLPPLRRAFLDGYMAKSRNARYLPQGQTFSVMLETLELEKAMYELRYEILHRPDWVQIPAEALAAF